VVLVSKNPIEMDKKLDTSRIGRQLNSALLEIEEL
jgi:hypothetical protein